jgi:hypothetical protein
MSALLIFSPKCPKCNELLQFISQNTRLAQMVHLHNVNTQGIPREYQNYIRSVPTLLVSGKLVTGANEIKNFLSSLFPSEIVNCDIKSSGNLFELNDYGMSLQPAMTPELIAKINAKVQ